MALPKDRGVVEISKHRIGSLQADPESNIGALIVRIGFLSRDL